MAKKIYRKKLTNSGGGVCFTAGLAAALACCAAAGDFLAALIYGQFYTIQVYPKYGNFSEQIRNHGSAAVTAVFAVIMFIWALSAARGKRLGREFGLLGIFMGASLCLLPAEQLYSLLISDLTDVYFGTGYDSDVFQGVVELARPGLPILSGLLLIFAGIAVLARISNEDFVVKAPEAGKKKKSAKKSDEYDDDLPDPRGFGDGKVEQGLTGETKPATYNDPTEEKPVHKERPAEPVKAETPAVQEAPAQEINKPAKKATIKLCPDCGELVGEDELFCANCGHRM